MIKDDKSVPDWSVVCLTCRENGSGKRWEVYSKAQANQIKHMHISVNDGHEMRIINNG